MTRRPPCLTNVRSILLVSLAAISAAAQPFSFGMKAGAPVTDFFTGTGTTQNVYTSITNRYVIGPTAELRLPFGLGVEFDALYRHFSYESPGFSPAPGIQLKSGLEQASGGSWEFPLLLKYRLPVPVVRPYLDAGISWNKIAGLNGLVCAINCGYTSNLQSLRHDTVAGFAAGAGVDLHVLFLHVSPEIRYTRWDADQFQAPTGGFGSNRNQVELLLGITY